MNLPEAEENLKVFKEKTKKDIIPISARTGEGTAELVGIIAKKLDEIG